MSQDLNTTPPLDIIDWGRTEYADAFERQKALVDLRRAGDAPDDGPPRRRPCSDVLLQYDVCCAYRSSKATPGVPAHGR